MKLVVEDTSLTSVANAIRTKGETTAQLKFPEGFNTAIANIQTGVEIIPPSIDSVEKNVGSTEIDLNVTATKGTLSLFHYEYSKDGGLTFVSSEEPTYIFTDLTKNTLYHIEIRAVDEVGEYSSYTEDITTLDSDPFAQWIKNNVPLVTSGVGLYHHTTDLENSAADNNYRYAGANPDNWVKFNNEDYRIIGVFGDNVKLIKNDIIGEKKWDDTNSNNWEQPATLNTYLNGEWYNSLGNDKNLIADYNWQIGGKDSSEYTAKQLYDGESSQITTNTYKIGLMSCSDYGFAALPGTNNWNTTLYNYGGEPHNSDWLYIQDTNQWAISRLSDFSSNVFYVHSDGDVVRDDARYLREVRPVFYLKPSVAYISGTGTQEDPFIIG